MGLGGQHWSKLAWRHLPTTLKPRISIWICKTGQNESAKQKLQSYFRLVQWFPNFSGVRTTWNILVLREAQNIDLYKDWWTTWATLADHQWSAEQTLGITGLVKDGSLGILNGNLVGIATHGQTEQIILEHSARITLLWWPQQISLVLFLISVICKTLLGKF